MKMGEMYQKKLEAKGFTVINPFQQEFNADDIVKLNANDNRKWDWENKYITSPESIVKNDLSLVNKSDAVVAIFPDNITIGITCEVFHAWTLGKYILVVVPDRLKEHPWLKYLSTKMLLRSEWEGDGV
jgi:nucleoside 2-deoxyribosyltransferase